MGERKGTNLYYPPDYDPKKGGINKFQGMDQFFFLISNIANKIFCSAHLLNFFTTIFQFQVPMHYVKGPENFIWVFLSSDSKCHIIYGVMDVEIT